MILIQVIIISHLDSSKNISLVLCSLITPSHLSFSFAVKFTFFKGHSDIIFAWFQKAPHCLVSAQPGGQGVPVLHYFLPGFQVWGRGVIPSPLELLAVCGDIFDSHSGRVGREVQASSGRGQGCF